MSYVREVENLKTVNRGLMLAVFGLTALLGGSLYGWHQSRKGITVYVPPDLSQGVVLQAEDVSIPVVYNFAHYILQHLNYWPKDGDADYADRIRKLSAILTPRFREQLVRDYTERKTEGGINQLAGRTRRVLPVPGAAYDATRAQRISNDAWVVFLDFLLVETVRAVPVKEAAVRYSVRVVRYPVDKESNPWGLALDGYHEPPRRFDPVTEAPTK